MKAPTAVQFTIAHIADGVPLVSGKPSENSLKLRFGDTSGGLIWKQPRKLPFTAFGEALFATMDEKDMKIHDGRTEFAIRELFLVAIATDPSSPRVAEHTRLLPGLALGNLMGIEALDRPPFGYAPPFRFARRYQQNF